MPIKSRQGFLILNIHSREYCATTKNELLLPAATCLNLTDLMLIERSQNKGNDAKLVYAGIYDDIVIREFREISPLGGY